jgi:hypothetical protein
VPLRICVLLPLIPGGQVATLLHQDIESACLIAVADVQQQLPTHIGVAIVTSLTLHTHHTVQTAL